MDDSERRITDYPPVTPEPIELLENRISELAAQVHAATCRLLSLLAEFDRRGGWQRSGMLSCAHWLNWRCGIGLVAAREKVRVAHALEGLPLIAASFRKGVVSYSKVRAMVRVATPENEAQLLEIARHGTASHVEQVVSRYRRVQGDAETERANALDAGRYLRFDHDDEGAFVLTVRLPPEVGALVLKALDEASEVLYQRERSACEVAEPGPGDSAESKPLSYTARRADALALLAESFLANGAATRAGGDRQQIVVHIDAECLTDSGADGRAELDHGPSIAAETARRLACDGGIVAMVEGSDGTPLDAGRKTRSIQPAMQRALASRDGGCRFPGCTNRHFVEGHHVVHWANGGETRLDNLVQLCHRHHRAVHEGGFRIESVDGSFRFLRPDGSVIECGADVDSAESSGYLGQNFNAATPATRGPG